MMMPKPHSRIIGATCLSQRFQLSNDVYRQCSYPTLAGSGRRLGMALLAMNRTRPMMMMV